MENIFDVQQTQHYINRIQHLTPETVGLWGKMSVEDMLAHCNVTYEFIYEPEKHKKHAKKALRSVKIRKNLKNCEDRQKT